MKTRTTTVGALHRALTRAATEAAEDFRGEPSMIAYAHMSRVLDLWRDVDDDATLSAICERRFLNLAAAHPAEHAEVMEAAYCRAHDC